MEQLPQVAGRRSILVADDEPQNILLLRKRLEAAGYRVMAAENGRTALMKARTHQPDLILLDLMMPDLDGFSVLAELQSDPATAHIPVIFVSAETDSMRRVAALGQGGHDYITKPFHPEELLARVGAALRIKEAYDALQRQRAELDQLARRDALTGLYNRRHLEERLAWELERHSACALPLSVILLDLDHFKLVNDTFGHPAGDAVLRELAGLLTNRLREEDIPGRYGGEEFLIVLPRTAERGSVQVADAIRRTVAAHRFVACPEHRVTLSAGVVTTCSQGKGVLDPTMLVTLADRRLYEAKGRGRNRVVPEMEMV